MDMSEIRKLHLSTINHLLYFSNDDSVELRKIYEDLFVETWNSVPQDSRGKILENLDFILCKKVDDLWQQGTPACALLNRINLRCFVIFHPFSEIIEHETKVHILAHELAHVYYNHPRIGFEQGCDKEKKYIEEEAEPQAYAITEKWKICPHPNDIRNLPSYRRFVLETK
jgi:hypothetical protein